MQESETELHKVVAACLRGRDVSETVHVACRVPRGAVR